MGGDWEEKRAAVCACSRAAGGPVIRDWLGRLVARSVRPSAGAIMADAASQMLLGSGLTILSQPLMYVKVLIQV